MDEDAPLAGQESSDYKKSVQERADKIKKLHDDMPDNEIVTEMYEDVMAEQKQLDQTGPSPMSYIHEAVWAADEAYRDGSSFSKVCADLCEAIDACSTFTDDSKQFASDGPQKATNKY